MISIQFLEREAQNQTGLLVKGPLIDAKAQISTDSNIGHSTRVEERASIKKSVVGRHCVIGRAVKIAGCVILDHCVIGDGCGPRLSFIVTLWLTFRRAKLEGCILGGSTKVGPKAELSKCVTQAGFEVDAGGVFSPCVFWYDLLTIYYIDLHAGNYRNAKLEISDWTTTGAYDDEDSDEDEDSEAESEDV